MANININRNLSDQFYRYKMPKLIAKVEGKGNGIKTVIVNMPEIAKALNRPPMYPTKYFGVQLGAQVNFDSKSERYIVNGAHDPNKLQDLLDGFISKYVLCQSCNNPETILSVNKRKEVIATNCMACGFAGTIAANNDRVAAYILKNPPPKPVAAAAPTAAAAAAAAAAQADTNQSNTETTREEDDDEDWGEDTTDDAIRKRQDALSVGVKSLMLNEDLKKSEKERMYMFLEFVENKAEKTDLTAAEHQKTIKAEADRLDISDKAPIALCAILLKDNLIEKIKTYKNLFLRFTNENIRAQRNTLRGLEMVIEGEESPKKEPLINKLSSILNTFYDLEIIVEDAFLEWYAKLQKKSPNSSILKSAQPFIKWLNEASEESDEDEDEVAVDFDDRTVGIKVEKKEDEKEEKSNQTKAPSNNSNNVKEGPAADDIDIDAI